MLLTLLSVLGDSVNDLRDAKKLSKQREFNEIIDDANHNNLPF